MSADDRTEYPKELLDLAGRLSASGRVLYAVGGCVRDALLGAPVHDLDITSAMPPETIIPVLEEMGVPYESIHAGLGTLLLWPDTHRIEYTAFRTESYGAGGAHTPDRVSFTDDMEKDARRRDFSVNALYRNILTGGITDPTGGLADLKNRVLRTTTEDPAVILRDDGLRILRLVRFAARLSFTVEERTFACAGEQAGLLREIAWERKREELIRILTGQNVFFALRMLLELGVFPYVLPALCTCDGVPQREDYHRYDVLTHCFHTCESAPDDPVLRLAGLLHDVGKPAAIRETGTMHGHDALGEAIAREALTTLRFDNRTVDEVCFLIRRHMFDLDGRAKEATLRKRFCLWGEARTESLIALREADIRGSGMDTAYTADRWRRVLAEMRTGGVPFMGNGLAVTGTEIMAAAGLPAGREIGRIREALILHCALRPADNRKKRLLALSKAYAKDAKNEPGGADGL